MCMINALDEEREKEMRSWAIVDLMIHAGES